MKANAPEQYISKSALVAEIKKARNRNSKNKSTLAAAFEDNYLLCFIDTLKVKEVDEQKERMSECPFRQVGCTMYEGKILECDGACSWVVDHLKLKELKAQKGEEV